MEALTLASDGHGHGLLSTVPAAVNGGDPLLHPPLLPDSPPTSSSSSSPHRAAADADPIFSLFDPVEIAGEDGYDAAISPASPRSQDAPSRSGRSSVSEYSRITVSDPQKELETASSLVPGSGSYVTYLISTRIGSGSGDIRTRRRFRDVVILADRLAEAYRGYFIPQRPDKSVVEGQVMHKHEFVEQRRSAIAKYLNRLAAHPVIGRSDELRLFLRMPGNSPLSVSTDAATRSDGTGTLPRQAYGEARGGNAVVAPQSTAQPAKGGRDLMKIFRELKQSVTNDWGGTKPLVIEEDQEFLGRKVKVQDLEQQLTTASKQAETLVKAQQDTGDTVGELGLTFVKLAKYETDNATYLSQRRRAAEIKQFSTAALRTSRFYRESIAQTVKNLDTLHEYLGLMLSVHSAFTDRSNALLTLQALTADLSSLHAREEKLEASSLRFGDKSKFRKVEELKESIRITEDAKICAMKEYNRIKENNKYELERLDRERREDFLVMLKGFVSNQVNYAEKIGSVWANLAEETKGYANEVDI